MTFFLAYDVIVFNPLASETNEPILSNILTSQQLNN